MRHLLYILILIFPSLSLAQYSFDYPVVLTEKDGLADVYVRTIAEDDDGFMWIATYDGLSRFDGRSFKNFFQKEEASSVHQHMIMDLLFDRQGRFWVVSSAGIHRYIKERETFETIAWTSLNEKVKPSQWFNCIFEDHEGTLWVGTDSYGICRFDPEQQTLEPFPFEVESAKPLINPGHINRINAIVEDIEQDSLLWVATSAGLFEFNKYTKRYNWHYFPQENPEEEYRRNTWRHIYPHTDGKLYLGGWLGAGSFDPYTGKFTPITPKLDFSDPNVVSIACMGEDIMWITYQQGLVIYDTKKRKIVREYHNDPDRQKVYGAYFMDRQRRIWTASDAGLFVYNPILQQFNTFINPLANNGNFNYESRALLESKDGKNLYISPLDGEGIYVFDRQSESWELVRAPRNYKSPRGVHGYDLIRLRDGRVLVLSGRGLFLFREAARKLELIPLVDLPTDSILSEIIEDRNGTLWVGTRRGGLLRIDPRTWRVRQYKTELDTEDFTGRHRWVEGFVEDSFGNIWMRASPGFSVYDIARDTLLNFPTDPGLGKDNPMDIINFTKDQQGNIWAATLGHGICRFDPRFPERGVQQRFGVEDGLPGTPAYIQRDLNNYLWINTFEGLVRFDPKAETFQHYSQGYGYPKENARLMVPLSTGEMALLMEKGFCLFQPQNLKLNHENPRPYFTSFRVFDEKIDTAQSLRHAENWNLSYKENFFSFEFSAIAYNMPDAVQFAYQLVGVDKDWIYAGDRRYASYTNIPGGNYTFRVKAANNEGEWSEDFAEINIHISTPWWRTWWFLTLLALGLLGAIYGFYKFRINEFRKQEQLKTDFERQLANVRMDALRAQINPHFIFNCLNSIDYYIVKNESQKASEYLNRFSRLIRLILQNSSANFVPLKDELEALQLYMEMESMRFNHSFDYVVKVEKEMDIDNLEIPPMMLQPYVENAIWHGLMHKGAKGHIDIEITRENGHLHCVIEDNGVGRARAQALKSKNSTKKRSMGMSITRNRIELLNQLHNTNTTVKIIDLKDEREQGNGTRVELNIPLN